MITINIKGKASITLSGTSPAILSSAISTIAAKPAGELEWSNTLLDGERVDYAAAEKAVAKLGDGWRLPTRAELETLLDITLHEPAIDTDKYPDTKSSSYWTSTPCAWNDSARWVVLFSSGGVNATLQDYGACVRAVRASQ